MDFNRPRQDNFSSSAENSINRRSSSSSSSNNNNINSNNNNNNNIFNKQSNNFKQSPTGGRCNSDPKTICSRNDSYDTNAGSSADNNKCSSPTEGVNNKITTSGGPSTPNAGDDPETKEPLKYISEDSGGIVSSVKCQDNNVSGNEHEILYNDFVNHLCPLPNDREHFQQNNNCSSGIASETDSLLPSAQKFMINSEVIDENTEDVKPLLVFEHQNEKKRPKSIVKSPSAQSFNSDQSVRARNRGNQRQRLSLQCPTTATAETERPVLHVQFLRHENDGSPSSICSDEDDKKDICSSPIGSISSSSSSDSSSSSSSSSSDEEYSEARPPDGGWGWVIVFASFMVNLIADGITFSFGVIFVEFLNYFGEGKAKTAWIGSLFMAMPLLSGPIASFLTDRYGCRKVTVAGSILASTGFVISAFSNSMEMLFFTFGILAGFGLSLCYVAAVVIVAYYFDKKRSFATGLSVCGSGIGTFIFAPITQILLEEYGWRGTTLILAGAFLNMTVCGMLMRDLEWTTHKAKSKAKEKKGKNNKMGVSADSFSVSNSTNTGGTASNLQQPIGGTGSSNDDLRNSDSKIEDPDDPRLFSSLITLPTFVRNGEKVPPEVLELLSTHRNVLLLQNYPGLLHSRSFSEPLSSRNGLSPEGTVSPSNKVHSPNDVGYHASRPNHAPTNEQALLAILKRNENHQARDKPTAAYLKDLRMHRHSLTYRGAMLNINRYRLRASSCPDIYRNSMTTIAKEKTQWYQGIDEFKNLFLDILDFSHFADMRFLLFALSNFLLYTWYDVPYVYLADNAIGMGFSETDASVLISIIGIVNMFGEIGLGWIGDRKWINPTLVYALCMALCGAVIALVPLFKTYTALSAISGAFGLFIAANYSLTSIILVELITIERFTNAYGLLLLVQGIANLVGPPLAGWVYDKTGNYDLSFYLAGFFIAISGGLLVVLPALGKYRKYRALKRQNSGTRSEKDPVNSMDCSSSKSNGTTLLSDCFGKDLIKDNVRMNHV